jgi:hypothetical protein
MKLNQKANLAYIFSPRKGRLKLGQNRNIWTNG